MVNLTQHTNSTLLDGDPGLVPADMELMKNCRLFEFVVCTVIIGVLSFLGLVGNVTSFFVLRKHKSETATIFLLQVLAVSDSILLLCSALVYTLSSIYPTVGGLKELFDSCRLLQTYIWPVSLMAHTTTIYITVLVTLNRYCAVCRPSVPLGAYFLQATKLQVVAVVSFSVLYNTPRFFEHQVMRIEEQPLHPNATPGTAPNVTYFNVGDDKVYQIIYSNVLYFPVMYIVPLVSLTCLNYRLMRGLREIRQKKAALTGHRAVRDDHITTIIIVIVFVFIVCQTPALVNQIFWAAMDHADRECGHFHFYYTKVSDVLVVFNSSTNFVIYCLFGKRFRRAFVESICKRPFRRQQPSTDPSMQPLQDL